MAFIATDADALEFVKRVEDSKVFGRSSRRPVLLEHLLKSETARKGKNLKAHSIGLDIFQKDVDFDPSTDSIVRAEMGRLSASIT